MKKINIPIKKDGKTDIFIIFSIALVIFCCIGLLTSFLYLRSGISNETKIIKVKYANLHGITDNCGHPISYNTATTPPSPNLGETYEIIVTTDKDFKYISSIKPISSEKYIEDCSVI